MIHENSVGKTEISRIIARHQYIEAVTRLLKRNPVVAIPGARQVGKTTLARQLMKALRGPATGFDLENPSDLARLSDPTLTLEELRGLVVLDEIQRRPDLFPVLRVLLDRPRSRARFLVLGSASPALLKQSSETLAGRIAFCELSGFSLGEVGTKELDKLWIRGGFPRLFLAQTDAVSIEWRRDFIRTFLERNIPQLGISIAARTLHRFWSMLAHYHGQIWNASEFGRSFGVADTTVRNYLDILTDTLMVRQLPPWTENVRKRQVKSPKIYLSDSGLLHSILDLKTKRDLEAHPKLGASWEGFLFESIVRQLGLRREQCYFWATHGGAELDLLVIEGRYRYGFEFKRTTSPQITRSMQSALSDLRLTRLDIVHAGKDTFPLAKRVRAVAARQITKSFG
ncbi:MAG: ATP-binding protein [Deltaproteobacteria bacterium]|nr:ATP-binding protein [Deltaproteobacteria bacterium]